MTAPLVDVADLCVALRGPAGWTQALAGVSFSMGRERLGIVGESAAGKSTVGRSLLGLLPPDSRVTAPTTFCAMRRRFAAARSA